tara:strand:+ start:353 stop:1195 length:843 start_codon:yes stop_codon:yes gene_type:complete
VITSIIFSKDRPLQADLALKSIYKNFPQSKFNIVIYDCSPELEDAYATLRKEHPNTQWWKQQSSLFKDVWVAAAFAETNHICFFTDDDIVFEEVPEIKMEALQDDLVTCFSLRMGLNINRRDCEGESFSDLPNKPMLSDEGYVFWNKTVHGYGSYWSYSLSVDGHIFRKTDVLDMLGELIYLEGYKKWKQNPNELEAALQRFWTIRPPIILSFQTSKIVNSPNNKVSNSCTENISGHEHSYSKDELLKLFMDGKRIDLGLLEIQNISCPHTEIDILKGLQ